MKGNRFSSANKNTPRTELISGDEVDGVNANFFLVPLAGFANPMYADLLPATSIGWDISDCVAVAVSLDTGPTSTNVIEQTNDPDGLVGWSTVIGKRPDTGAAATSVVVGSATVVPAVGMRMRIRVTALTVADAKFRVAKEFTFLDQSPVVVTLASSAVTIGRVESALAEDVLLTTQSAMPTALEARSTQKAAVTGSGRKVNAQGTMDGKQVVQLDSIPELQWAYAAVAGGIVSSVADVPIKAAGGATIRNYLKNIHISHDLLAAATEFVIKDGAATVLFRGKLQAAATEGFDIQFPTPLRSSLNAALNFALITAVTGGVFVNAEGYTGL